MTQLELKPPTAKEKILARLREHGGWLAIHEFNIPDVSQNSIGTRLPELAIEKKVVSRRRDGKAYSEWRLAVNGQ